MHARVNLISLLRNIADGLERAASVPNAHSNAVLLREAATLLEHVRDGEASFGEFARIYCLECVITSTAGKPIEA